MDSVLVSGASGFIAQHVIKLLVNKGYSVVGTVRLSNKGEKLKNNLEAIAPGKFQYEIVEELSTAGAFDETFSKHPEVTYVLHIASPCFFNTTDQENDIVIPAIRGTECMMNAIKRQVKAGSCKIKRVVVTSSDAALFSFKDEHDPLLSFDETSWNNTPYEDALSDPVNAYYGAKAYAERAAWDIAGLVSNFPPLTTVNPAYVFGPQAFENEVGSTLNVTNEMINELLDKPEDTTFENEAGGFINVGDIAKAHLAAFEQENTVGKRLYVANGLFSVQTMLDVINERFDLKVPKGNPGLGPEDILKLAKTSNETTRKILGFEFVPLEKTVVDVVNQILKVQGRG